MTPDDPDDRPKPLDLEDHGRYAHESWWSSWGKPIALLGLGVIAVAGVIVLVLVLVGALF